MKSIWTLFVLGIFMVGIATVAMKNISAQTKDQRAPVMNDSSLSGIRVPVPDTEEMLTAIEKKERDLEEREKRLKQLEERLAVEEERIKIRVAELEQLQNEIEKSRSKYKVEDQKVLARMVKTFETMVPKKAAAVLSSMDEPLAVELLMTMKEKKVAQVLEAMEPTRAVALNALIASRRPAGREDANKEQGAVEAQK